MIGGPVPRGEQALCWSGPARFAFRGRRQRQIRDLDTHRPRPTMPTSRRWWPRVAPLPSIPRTRYANSDHAAVHMDPLLRYEGLAGLERVGRPCNSAVLSGRGEPFDGDTDRHRRLTSTAVVMNVLLRILALQAHPRRWGRPPTARLLANDTPAISKRSTHTSPDLRPVRGIGASPGGKTEDKTTRPKGFGSGKRL